MSNKELWLGNLLGHGRSFAYGVWSINGLCPTLTTMQGGGRTPYIIVDGDEETLRKEIKNAKSRRIEKRNKRV